MTKVFDLGESVLSKELQMKIDGKLDKSEAVADYRKKSEGITEDDLDPALRLLIQSGGGSGGPITDEDGNVVAYDDTALRARIVSLESDKQNKSEMVNYYKKDETIHEANISPAYKNAVAEDIADINEELANLQSTKVENTELAAYRKKTDKISEMDLAKTLYDKILAGGGGGTGGVSLETVQTMIGNLDAAKADKSQLDLVRKIAVPIGMTDVDSALEEALNKAMIAAAGLTNKADKSELALYRKLANPIALADMDSNLASQLSIALNASNDIESFVTEYMGNVKNQIIADVTNAYGQQDQLDFPFQWDITMDYYPGNEGHYTVFWALNVLYRELKNLNGRDADEGGPAVAGRVPALETKVSTLESSLSSANTGTNQLKTRMTTAEEEIDNLQSALTTANNKVAALEADVATLKSIISALHPDIAASI